MSFVIAAPETVSWAASDLARIGSMIDAAHASAAASTTAVLPAAADEVSAAAAALFSGHAQGFQALGAQAATFHAQFVQLMTAGAGAYAGADAANASPLQAITQQVLGVINTPTQVLLGRPLIGNGANGTPGTGANGGARRRRGCRRDGVLEPSRMRPPGSSSATSNAPRRRSRARGSAYHRPHTRPPVTWARCATNAPG
jgi:hypothetical protein